MNWKAPVGAAAFGAFSGFIAAARVDYLAFKSWRDDPNFIDRVVAYQWKVACWRWAEGAVSGAVSGVGGYYGLDVLKGFG